MNIATKPIDILLVEDSPSDALLTKRALGDARLINRGQEVHCAGALIFAEKNSTATQMMRICERIGIYKPEGIIDSKSWDKVFDDFDEMVSAHTEDWEESRDKAKEHRNKDGNEHLPVDE